MSQQRVEGLREVAPFSSICHYLKWSLIHYASTESGGLIVEGGAQCRSGRGDGKGGCGSTQSGSLQPLGPAGS